MPLLVRAEAVEVLVVDHEGEAPRHGQEPGADIAYHLARHGARVEVRRLSSRGEDLGRLLLSRAASFGADLVVMGAFGHSRPSEWVFGGVTQTALVEAALPVLMCR
jgi:nucleotide-binding universal stress UspA family protein